MITSTLWNNRRLVLTFAAASTVCVVAGCGLTVEDLPLPEPGVDGETYTLHAEFDNTLNLPDQAKVKIGGSDVGVVSSIKTKDFTAIIDLRIERGIVLPEGSTAQLRQATPLGDVFVALEQPRSKPGARVLVDGDTLSREFTSAGATVEELLISVSMLFNGGGVASLSRLGNELGTILDGHGGELAHLVTEMTGVISELNNNSARIDTVLGEFDTLAGTIETNSSELREVAATLPSAIGTIAENNNAIGDLLTGVATASAALGDYSSTTGDQMSSLLDNLNNLMGALAAAGDSVGYVLDQLHEIRPVLDTNFRGKAWAVVATVTNLDVGLLTDPANSKLWDMKDVNDFVGSFLQVLQIVQGRLGGPR